MRVAWFNQQYVEKSVHANDQIVFSGLVTLYQGQRTMQSPEFEPADRAISCTPAGSSRSIRATEGRSAGFCGGSKRPRSTSSRTDCRSISRPTCLLARTCSSLGEAVRQYHLPDDKDQLEGARHRLAFDELFVIQLGVPAPRHGRRASRPSRSCSIRRSSAPLRRFPFALTGAQRRVLGEILDDWRAPSR